MEGNKVQNKSGKNFNVDANVKSIIYMKKNIFKILLRVASKMEST